jgi:hypothetical protein
MAKLRPEDWQRLRNTYKVAFQGWADENFQLLLDKVYGSASNSADADDTDALMIQMARTEPPIPPKLLK